MKNAMPSAWCSSCRLASAMSSPTSLAFRSVACFGVNHLDLALDDFNLVAQPEGLFLHAFSAVRIATFVLALMPSLAMVP